MKLFYIEDKYILIYRFVIILVLTITLLELQDFLSSRFDEVLYLIGDRFRYILTETISPFIGLIWRGIIDGLKK